MVFHTSLPRRSWAGGVRPSDGRSGDRSDGLGGVRGVDDVEPDDEAHGEDGARRGVGLATSVDDVNAEHARARLRDNGADPAERKRTALSRSGVYGPHVRYRFRRRPEWPWPSRPYPVLLQFLVALS